ncbi:MAG: DUF4169 family protein [Alphaproteobacteria bacterium]
MADILNLRRHRKNRNRRKAAQTAIENRLRFGKTKAEKLQETRDKVRNDRLLSGHRLSESED